MKKMIVWPQTMYCLIATKKYGGDVRKAMSGKQKFRIEQEEKGAHIALVDMLLTEKTIYKLSTLL